MSDSEEALKPEETSLSPNSLYKDCRLFLDASILVYGFADLRELARQGKLSDPSSAEAILSPDGDGSISLRYFDKNKDAVMKHLGRGAELYLTAVEDIKNEIDLGEGNKTPSRLVVFDDERNASECVYAVVLDRHFKRIIVVFRGSVTPNDWLIDAKTHMKEIPNPVSSVEKEFLQIHAGFHEYLFGTTPDRKQSKFDKIMGEVAELVKENPGYGVFTTGHSLGGALGTLFAFSAAASSDSQIPKPVISINFASPRVGNDSFRDAVEVLEKQELLYILRVANHQDPVTQMPVSHAWLCGWRCLPTHTFRHVGLELQLKRDDSHVFIHSTSKGYSSSRAMKDLKRDIVGLLRCLACSCFCSHGIPIFHVCHEYVKRLRNSSKDLGKMKVSNLWKEPHRRKMGMRESVCR